jgi:hypothetical protein
MPRAATRYQRRDQPTPRSATKRRASELNSLAIKDLNRKLATKPVVDTTEQSDDSDGLVVKRPGPRHYDQNDNNNLVYASGGLGSGDKPKAHQPRTEQRKRMMQAAQKTKQAPQKSVTEAPASQSSVSNGPQEQRKQISRSNSTSVARPGSAQPTPSRDTSVLDVIKPRKRQNSILKRPSLEDSSLGLTDESFALPDAESTPLPPSKAQPDETSLPTSNSMPSNSRKRKLGASEPVNSASKLLYRHNPPASSPLPEPSLPPQALSNLRASGRKQHRRLSDEDDDDDVMAPPASSSSSNSSVKSTNSTEKIDHKPRQILTKQLQDLMPTKRRKTARKAKKVDPEFDIPEDSDIQFEHVSDTEEASIFLPKAQKTRKTRARGKGSGKSNQDIVDRSAKTKTNPKKPSTRLTLSRTTGNQTTKSPSQQSTSSPTRSLSIGPQLRSGLRRAERLDREKPFGGSPLKASTAGIEDKENDTIEDTVAASPAKKVANKWADIDNWDMDFEEVEVWERSSEKDAR